MIDGESGREGIELGPLVEDAPPGKMRWSIRRMMIVVTVVAFLFGVVRPAYFVFDAMSHGPYARAYNQACQRLADEAHLIGRPEADIIKVLGMPTDIYNYGGEGDGWARIYNYWPSWIVPAGVFQVHCENGVVVSLEQLDD